MNIDELQKVNEERAKRWHEGGDWTLLEWAGAMCGESGEAANYAKKIKRINTNLPNREAGIPVSNLRELQMKCALEVADSIIYGLIMLSRLDVRASDALRHVYDTKSIEYGFPERAPK